jgi:hypothetical protein
VRDARLIALALALALAAAGVEPVRPSEFTVGVCTHFGQGKGLLRANLSLIRQAGVNSIRDEVVWRGVETAKGRLEMPDEWQAFVRSAAAAGLAPLLILDYGNPFYDHGDKPSSDEALEAFTRYAEFVVRTFKGVVRRYELWNEYDIKIGGTTPGSAENYAKLVKKVYPRIKAIDSTITVLGGAVTPGGVRNGWLERMLAAGALPFMDAVSIHTYNYGRPGRERTPETWAQWMAEVEQLIAKYNDGKPAPVYITEMGWPTQDDSRGTPPRRSADYLARLYLLARTMPFLKGIWWYDFQDDGWNPNYNEDNFGLVRPDLTPKPGYFVLSQISTLARNSRFLRRVDAGDSDLYVLEFRDRAGKATWAVWNAADDDVQVAFRTTAKDPAPLALAEIGTGSFEREWGARDWTVHRNAAETRNEIRLIVGGTPWLIHGDLSRATIAGVKRRPWTPPALR